MDRGANDRGYAVGGSLQMQLEAPMTNQKVSLRVACPSDRALQAVKQDLPAITSHACRRLGGAWLPGVADFED